jgi:hypothetical protein
VHPLLQPLLATKRHLKKILFFSELIMVLNHVKKGGLLVLLLHHLDNYSTAELVSDMKKCAKNVKIHKPQVMYKHQISFYIIVEGIDPDCLAAGELRGKREDGWRKGKRIESIINNLRSVDEAKKAEGVRMLTRLVETEASDGASGVSSFLGASDVDTAAQDLWESSGESLMSLARRYELWTTQKQGLEDVRIKAGNLAAKTG